MIYAFIENDKINGTGECKCLGDNVLNIEITTEIADNIERYIWDGEEIIINPNYEKEQAEKREQEFKSNFFQIPNYGWYIIFLIILLFI